MIRVTTLWAAISRITVLEGYVTVHANRMFVVLFHIVTPTSTVLLVETLDERFLTATANSVHIGQNISHFPLLPEKSTCAVISTRNMWLLGAT